jgi:hypothetical protein
MQSKNPLGLWFALREQGYHTIAECVCRTSPQDRGKAALGLFCFSFPAPTRWANVCRTYRRFGKGLAPGPGRGGQGAPRLERRGHRESQNKR